MTALLTDAAVREQDGRIHDAAVAGMKPGTPRYSGEGEEIARFQFIEGYSVGYFIAQEIYEARLAEDAKVRAGLVEALEAVKASWTNNDPLRAQHILQINDALASAKLLA